MIALLLFCLSIPLLPAFLFAVSGLKNINNPQNSGFKINFFEIFWLAPTYLLISLSWIISSETIFGDTGNGSKMAVYAIIFYILTTLASLLGYLATMIKKSKGRTFRWSLIIASLLIFFPFYVFCIQLSVIFSIEALKSAGFY